MHRPDTLLLCARIVPLILVMTAANAESLPQGLTCGLSYQNNYYQGFDNSCIGYPTFVSHVPGGGAPNYQFVYDGDNGLPYGFPNWLGFAHQELQPCPQQNPNCLPGGLSVATYGMNSTQFVLPQGAVCGFHHTYYTPGRTCMGYNPSRAFSDIHDDQTGVPGCPPEWQARRGFDMNSGTEYWTWCAYSDPNNLSITGSPAPSLASAAVGVACGAVHNDPLNDRNALCMGYFTQGGGNQALCPAGASTTNWYDDGESAGEGLGVCTLNSNAFPSPALPYGTLDTHTSTDGNFAGWAFDANSSSTSIFVDVYLDGPAGSGSFLTRVTANGSRPDVNSAFGITGNHGFGFSLPSQYLGSNHTVYVYAIALFNQGNTHVSGSPGSYRPPGCRPPTIDCCDDGRCFTSCSGVRCP